MKFFFSLLALSIIFISCTTDPATIACKLDKDCEAGTQYCDFSEIFTDDTGASFGSCVEASVCVSGKCDAGFYCDSKNICKPLINNDVDSYSYEYDYQPDKDYDLKKEADYLKPEIDYLKPDYYYPDPDYYKPDPDYYKPEADIKPDPDYIPVESEALPDDDEDFVKPDDDTPPTAVFTSPGDNAISSNLKPDIIITFSEAIDNSTVLLNESLKFEPYFTYTTQWNSAKTILTIKPDLDLVDEGLTELFLTQEIKDYAGNPLNKEYSWKFITGKLIAASKKPDANDDEVPVTTVISVTFSKAVNASTVTTASFVMAPSGGNPIKGTFSFSDDKTVVTFTPSSPIMSDREFTVSLTNAIETAMKVPLVPVSWKFRTVDTVPPFVVSSSPVDGEQNAALSPITVLFSEPVKDLAPASVTLTKTCDSSLVTISTALSTDKKTATISPLVTLPTNTEYKLSLNPEGASPAISDLSGNPLAQKDIIFKTAAYGFKHVSAGGLHTCGIDLYGKLYCWGRNNYGQLGIGNKVDSSKPSKISNDSWLTVEAGKSHSCGIKDDNSLWCWGYNYSGQLGINSYTDQSSPMAAGSSWKAVTIGDAHTCGIKNDGTLWCWGSNYYGQLGLTANPYQMSTPDQVSPGTTWLSISAGGEFTCGIKSDRSLWCWGNNNSGQLGSGNIINYNVPKNESTASTDWSLVTGGRYHTCATKSNNILYCWGDNSYGQITGSGYKSSPAPISVDEWKTADMGYNHSCAIKVDGTLFCWGNNTNGQLGIGNTYDFSVPAQAGTASDWRLISAGGQYSSNNYAHTCAINQSFNLYCWGYNIYGELGDGTTTSKSEPVLIKHPLMPPPPAPAPGEDGVLYKLFTLFFSAFL